MAMAAGHAAAATHEEAGPIWPEVLNREGSSPVLLVCEHASKHIPLRYGDLGLSEDAKSSHAIWDPGAYEVARSLSQRLDAPLIAARVSRVLFDCNRPPEAPDSMPEACEIYQFPGNKGLSAEAKEERTRNIYQPFKETISKTIQDSARIEAIVTLHSFTPVFFGSPRAVEIGIIHDSDRRLADAMLAIAPEVTDLAIARNEPYGPEHGVTHTLKEHGQKNGLLNAMIEIRSDLIAGPQEQEEVSSMIASWIQRAKDR